MIGLRLVVTGRSLDRAAAASERVAVEAAQRTAARRQAAQGVRGERDAGDGARTSPHVVFIR